MAKKQLTRSLDTSTAAGQEEALRLLQQATQAKLSIAVPATLTTAKNTLPQYETPKKAATPKSKPNIEKRGRPAKGDPNIGASVKLVADGSSVKRINMDFPLDLYERVEAEIEETGQTVKGFFLMLTKQYFKTSIKNIDIADIVSSRHIGISAIRDTSNDAPF